MPNILYTIISTALVFSFIVPFDAILAAEDFPAPETQAELNVSQHTSGFKHY